LVSGMEIARTRRINIQSMKHLFIFSGLLLVACTGKQGSSAGSAPGKTAIQQPEPVLSQQAPNLEHRDPSPFFDSLTAEFEVRDFLENMQFGNSGGGSGIYYFRPKESGNYYSYFGSSHFSGDIFGKVTLTTYIYGNEIGMYNQQDQAFIELSVHVNDPALGKLDLIGRQASLFRNHPAVVFKSKRGVILQENEQALKLTFCDDKVCAFTYARIKNRFDQLSADEQNALRNAQ
jgi:hypothetical protein